jgi:hypothetical protein
MEELLETIKKQNSNLNLARHEKKAMRARLVLHMREENLYEEVEYAQEYKISRYLIVSNYITKHLAKATIIAIIFTLSGGASIFAAAESALPGNSLYNVKVHVSEELRFAFKNQEEKTNWEIERTKRRFEEATILSMQGQLPVALAGKIQENIQQHASEAVRRANKAASQDPQFAISAHQELASTLQAQTTVLESVQTGDTEASTIESIVKEAQIHTEIASQSEQQVVTSLIFFETEEESEVSEETKEQVIEMFADLSKKQQLLQEQLTNHATIQEKMISEEAIHLSISGKIEITSTLLTVVAELIESDLYEESLMFLQDIQQEILEADKIFGAIASIEILNEEKMLQTQDQQTDEVSDKIESDTAKETESMPEENLLIEDTVLEGEDIVVEDEILNLDLQESNDQEMTFEDEEEVVILAES